MNERIQGLQIRAVQLVADDCANGDVFRLNTGSHQVQNLISQKFAELIIQKCISQIALIGISNFQNNDISWTVETAIAKIQEHFGVKNA